jgi:hypothetical protein
MAYEQRDTYELIRRQTEALESIAKSLRIIAKEDAPPSPKVAVSYLVAVIPISQGELNMNAPKKVAGKIYFFPLLPSRTAKASGPIQISDSLPQVIAVFGVDEEGNVGASLPTGASIALSTGPGANGAPGSYAQDSVGGTYSFVDANGVQHNNVPSLGSGTFTPSPAPNSDPNDAFPFNYAITLAGGAAGDTGSAQFETAVGVEVSEVIGVPVAAPASAKK